MYVYLIVLYVLWRFVVYIRNSFKENRLIISGEEGKDKIEDVAI